LYFYQLFSKDFPKKKLQWEYELTKLNEDFEEQIKGLDINSNEYNKLLQKKEKRHKNLPEPSPRATEYAYIRRTTLLFLQG
jgi:hypothetical protein